MLHQMATDYRKVEKIIQSSAVMAMVSCVMFLFAKYTIQYQASQLEVCFVIIRAFNLRAALFWLCLEWSCSKPKLVLSVKQLQLFCNLPPLLFDQFNYSLANSSQNQTDLRRSDLPAMETTMDVSVAVKSHCSAISWTTLFYQSAPSHPKPPNVHVSTQFWHLWQQRYQGNSL